MSHYEGPDPSGFGLSVLVLAVIVVAILALIVLRVAR